MEEFAWRSDGDTLPFSGVRAVHARVPGRAPPARPSARARANTREFLLFAVRSLSPSFPVLGFACCLLYNRVC